MTKTKTKAKKREKCKCGGFKYNFVKHDNADEDLLSLKVCFKCGRFKGTSMSEEVVQLFCTEPELLLYMIESGYLQRVN